MKLSNDELCERRKRLSGLFGEIRNIAFGVGATEEDVEDLVQDIFIEAYNHIGEVKDMACLNSWVYKIAQRKLSRRRKKQDRRSDNETLFSPDEWEYINPVEDEKDKVYFIGHRRITDEDLFEMVKTLKPPAPEILQLRFDKGYTLKEISGMMDINYNTVKTIERRALAKIKKMILERNRHDDEIQKELY